MIWVKLLYLGGFVSQMDLNLTTEVTFYDAFCELQNHWTNNSSFKHSGKCWSSGKVNKPIKYGCIIIDSVHFLMTGHYSNSSILQQIKEELIWLFRFRPLEYLQQFRFFLHAIHFEGFSSDLEHR